MLQEWLRLWQARKWMKSNEKFLYTWHAYVGYSMHLFDLFLKGRTVQDAVSSQHLDESLLKRWVDVGVAIGHLKRKRNGKIKTRKKMRQSLSKSSHHSVGALLKEMMELHIPSLLSYPELLQGEKKNRFSEGHFASTVAETSTILERLVFPKVYRWIKKNNIQTVIDLGCGYAGYLMRLSEKRSNMELVGVEVNEEVCKEAKNRINSNKFNNIFLYQSDLRDWQYNKKVDMVMLNNLLYYFPQSERECLFEKAYKLTGENGTIGIITPLDAPNHGQAFSAAFNSFMNAHENLYPLPTIESMKADAKKHGFKIKKIQPVIKEGGWYFICFAKNR
ncbi:class I SAM-dependent methyltransferase [Bacillus taeanensis]|uniref:Class I SAM-dependent methyltransferase n=1 Tax=Bacillus taeanensis TaxID=273032 RepID=A0A366XWM7_9BACI|nr:class I SAM-dependent methyltransferase [Bacillus taeanensis]RBW69555.1 class I SAM-dependent methyltransferase [Bacillus taeanensis]